MYYNGRYTGPACGCGHNIHGNKISSSEANVQVDMDARSDETRASPIRRADEDVSDDEVWMDRIPLTLPHVATTMMTCVISQHSNGAIS